jgi:ubiquinone/menaquinone biosynthesis C-methylase UbiE
MNQVAEVYDKNPEREWERLARDPYHTLEFSVTWHYLQEYLPPNGQILDAGGGPGRYALELCQAGYEVVLLDISSGLISVAQDKFKKEPESVQKRLLEFAVGDIQDLSHLETNRFDAVLCLGGPLTHISDAVGRFQALSELVRVAKPGAIVCLSVMGYWAVLRTILARFSDELVTPYFETLVEQADTPGSTKTMWHFFRADELRQYAEKCGLTTLKMAGCEGLSTGLAEATNILGQDETKWQRWEKLVIKTSAEPSIVDMAEHILYIGRVVKA